MSAQPVEPHIIEDDFAFEPIPGLPEALPEGERVLWSDTPKWTAVALEIFHVRAIAIYAAVIVAFRAIATIADGGTMVAVVENLSLNLAITGVGFAILALLAFVTARTTRYTITNRRVVMRIGVALTMSVNLPFKQIKRVDYRAAPLGTGAIALTMEESGGLGYAVLWPHVRPLKFSKPQPMLRAMKDGERVAHILGHAIVASQGEAAPTIKVVSHAEPQSGPQAAEPKAARPARETRDVREPALA